MARDETSLENQTALQSDPEGNLRAELAAQLAHAHQALASQLGALFASAVDPALVAQIRDQLMGIAALQESVATSHGSALSSLRVTVQANVSAATSLAKEVAGTNWNVQASFELGAASFALRTEVVAAHTNLFEKRIFDPFLTFASAEDEAAYRQREAEARRYIDGQLARRTPEGDLNAAGATLGQMLDAHGNGAGKSPEFMGEWNRLMAVTERQRDVMRREGRSTEEFDRNISASVRSFLKQKGLSDDAIEVLASSPYPLDAVKPFLDDPNEAARLLHTVERDRNHSLALQAPIAEAAPMATPAGVARTTEPPDLADVMASFRAAGIKVGGGATADADGSSQTASLRQVAGPSRLV